MKQSKGYVVFYAMLLTIVCGTLLALASVGLKPRQNLNVALEKKKLILEAAMPLEANANIEKLYEERVKSYVVDAQGTIVADVKVEEVEVAREYKKKAEERLLPVYEINTEDQKGVLCYVLPVYGNGLWDSIWGYVAIKNDANTINGVSFDHKSETAGLGSRIATEEIQSRFVGKSIYRGAEVVGIEMQKGEQGGGERSIEFYKEDPHKVDGMSGATITGKGLSVMLIEYFNNYKPFLDSKKTS